MTPRRAASFDVFDTALVRTWARPADLFQAVGDEIGRRGLTTLSPEQWRILRVRAERKARKMSMSEETTLTDIYGILAEKSGWTLGDRDDAARVETDLEAASLRPVAEVAERIRALRGEGVRIIFLSDMYLDAGTIRRFLGEQGLWMNGDGLYVSSEFGVTKAGGGLYRVCLERENLLPGDIRHLGDNFESDVRVPRNLGIEAEFFPDAALNRYEEKIAADARLPFLARSRLAGASRAARLAVSGLDARGKTIAGVAASVAGPVLLGFVSWCLGEASRIGLRRLYFLSRDGNILIPAAERLRAEMGIDMDCRYLYGSRQAFHLPALETFGGREFGWLFEETSFLSIRSLLGRLGAVPDEFQAGLESAGFPRPVWDDAVAAEDRPFLGKIFDDPGIRTQILDRAAEGRRSLLGYLEQEGLFDKTPWGLVDIGWRGRLQNSLSRILDTAGRYPASGITGFYFSLFDRVAPYGKDRVSAFLDAPGCGSAAGLVRNHIPVLEIFTAAEHGVTLGHKPGPDGRFVPILREERNIAALDWGLKIHRQVLIGFADAWTRISDRDHSEAGFRTAVARSLLGLFLRNPTPAEAEVYGDFPFSEDQADQTRHALAPRITTGRFLEWCFFRGPLLSMVTWVEASVRRSFRSAGFFLAAVRLKSAMRRWLGGRRAL